MCYQREVQRSISPPIVILGAGFAGCATAWALAARGIRAIVLEREQGLGRFASGRGAGLGRQLCEDDATSALAIRGARILRERFTGVWQPTGGILSFADAAHAAAYVARAERLHVEHAVIDRDRVLAHWPRLAPLSIATAIHVPSDGVFDPLALLHAYAGGLDIRFGIAATRIGEGRVETTAGVIDARVIVDATGAWAGATVGDPPLDAFKRHLFVVEGRPVRAAPFVWHLGPDEMYLRGDGTHTIMSPCDSEVTEAADQQPSPDADARLRIPATIVKRWACQRAFAPDRLMRLGRDPQRPWLVWAAALGGHGATASAAVGEVVADSIAVNSDLR